MSTKPSARERFLPLSTRNTLRAVLEDVVREAMDNVASLQRTCMNCRHFSELDERCELAGARPPAHVIAFGCPSFDLDDIPF